MSLRCHIDVDGQFWIFKNDPYDQYHFNCANGAKELPYKLNVGNYEV